jgi:ABC-type transport system involved in multi-copper enzyme maturation permease subunit
MDHGGVRRVLAVAANTFRETVRERVLYNLLVFAGLMTVSGLVLGELSIRQDTKIVKDLGLATMELFGTAIALFIGVGLVSKEIERRSLYPLLAKPLGRIEFLIGKFFGLSFTLLVNVCVMTAVLYLTLFMTAFQDVKRSLVPDPLLLQAIFAIYLGLLLVVATALLFSTITSSSALAAVCAFAVVVIGRLADVIHHMQEVVPGAPVWLTQTLYYALPNFANFDLKARIVHGDAVGAGSLALLAAYACAYCGLLLGLAAISFRRKDLQ